MVLTNCHKAERQNTVVFAVVRSGRTSTHLATAIAGAKNVHVLDADVTDHGSLEVSYFYLMSYGTTLF